ncbi:translocation/assembly module TamB domain-containing protein [Litoreibacter arenae]|uniref:Translocation and assembly module TamB C-terminal domain-containing protein n=1 Tax=Litoreibacter arenae DSM 19593 TaxID=1123360 RepID=S9RMZ9_9RHOB|nr:translocation/assembly module TamB domain-containing protein [Litoreibacter arenae]EPX79475.1 hypothetical protein thalar_02300 [Litoreibacter arenae DSM 19593]
MMISPLAALAQGEESDRGFIQGLLEDALSTPGSTVRLEGFEGALSSKATADRVTVTDPEGVWFSATDISLVWNRSALLRGRIEIDEISIGSIDLPRPPVVEEPAMPSPEARGAFTLPDLPVAVKVESMSVGEIQIGAPLFGEAATISLSGNANLAGGAGDAVLEIKRLDQDGQFNLSAAFDNTTRELLLDLSLEEPADGIAANLLNLPGRPSVSLTVQGDDPIDDFEARISLATDGRERLKGLATIASQPEGATSFALEVDGDVAPVFVPDFADFLGDDVQLSTRGSLQAAGGLILEELRMQTAALFLTGSAEIGASGWPQNLNLKAEVIPPDGDSVVLPLSGPSTSVERVELTASFDADAGEAWKIEGFARGLTQESLQLDLARFAASGAIQPAEERVTGKINLSAEGIAPQNAALARAIGRQVAGALNFDWTRGAPLLLQEIDIAGADYGLTGEIAVNDLQSVEDIKIVPDLALAAQDLARFSGLAGLDLGGEATLDITGFVEPLTGVLAFDFDGATRQLATGIAQLDPLLTGDGTVKIGVSRNESGLEIDPVRIATDHANIDATASLRTDASRIELSAKVPELGRALPDLAEAAELSLDARQNGDVWSVEADAALPGGAKAQYKGTLRGLAEAKPVVDGVLTAEIARLAAFSGLAGRSLSGAASVSAEGKVDINAGSFDVTANGQGTALGFGAPAVEPLFRGTTRFDVAASRGEDGQVEISTLTLRGSGLDADVSGSFGPDNGSVTYRASIGNLELVVPGFPGAASVSGTAVKDQSAWIIDASGQGPGGVSVAANGRVAEDASTVNLSLNGAAPLGLLNSRLDGQNLTGLVRYNLVVNGPPALRSVSGQMSVADARLSSPALATSLDAINGSVQLSGGQAQVSLRSNVSSGGTLSLSGPVSLTAPFNAQLTGDLINVTLRKASLFEAQLGGRLGVAGPLAGGAKITGVINVETAELRIPQIGPSYSVLDGLRHLNPPRDVQRTLRFAGLDEPETAGAQFVGYPIDLTIQSPNRVFVRGRGLDAELGGTLRLTGTTNDLIPVGGFDLIRGRLDLLGRRLELTDGSVRLRGSFDPVIRFAASSQVEDVTVGLQLEGPASAPDLNVTSVPTLPEEEALSFLLFGRDVTQISAFQAVQLALAVQTLSGRGGPGLTERVRENLGVDDLDFGTDAEGNTQASVGKYISDNIYTDVTVKSTGETQINLNLEVTPNVKVRGRLGSDGNTGVGLFYERDY